MSKGEMLMWQKKLKTILNIDEIEIKRMELYSLLVSVVLSKSIFKSNKELNFLFDSLNIKVKPYLLKSRTISLGKLIRVLEKSNSDEIDIFIDCFAKLLDYKIPTSSPKSNSSKNYMEELLKKYGR
ncbi:hypothetical protein [Peptacetobacter sp. AB845]|uniref:hypothetical protein n=1 Tax=Peptacetobacter sp. AB845 TaxID=3388429 RepID=UPI0039C96718